MTRWVHALVPGILSLVFLTAAADGARGVEPPGDAMAGEPRFELKVAKGRLTLEAAQVPLLGLLVEICQEAEQLRSQLPKR